MDNLSKVIEAEAENHNSTQPTEQPEVLYRWVKASERLPEDKRGVQIFRKIGHITTTRPVCLDYTPNVAAYLQTEIGLIEWLEPLPSQPSVDALESKIEKLLRTTPLKTRLKVSNWMEFVDLIVSLGYRENKAWGEDENELNYKITLAADKYADRIIETVAEFYKDASKVDAEPSPQEPSKK